MEVQNILCKAIDVPKVASDVRTFNREFAMKLADSIKVDGLLVPPAVRKNPDAPGRYILINGKHKLYAVKNVLKQDLIEARVLDMDDEEAEIARDVEQLWHNPLTAAQHTAAIKRWHAHWVKNLPALPTQGESQEEMPVRNAQASSEPAAESTAPEAPFDTATPPSAETQKTMTPEEKAVNKVDGRKKPESHKESTFDQRVAVATGQSTDTVRRAKGLAKLFDEDELEVFKQCDVTQADMTWISRAKDKELRTRVISLIAGGVSVEEAMKVVMGENVPSRDHTDPAQSEAKASIEPDLPDDEWFERYCGEKAAMLRNKHKFKADAITFRRLTECRHVFRTKAKGVLKDIAKAGIKGPFWNLINRVISLSHPKDWPVCSDCAGTGIQRGTPEDQQVKPNCPGCYGNGYKLKTEEYL